MKFQHFNLSAFSVLVLCLCGCAMPSHWNGGAKVEPPMPPIPVANVRQPRVLESVVIPPTRRELIIPIKYPTGSAFEIYGSPNVNGPWKFLTYFEGKPDGSTLDVPGYGATGFYKIVAVGN